MKINVRNKYYEIIRAVRKFLNGTNGRFIFDEDSSTFMFDVRTGYSIRLINFQIKVYETSMIIYGYCPIGADSDDAEMMAEMRKFIDCKTPVIQGDKFELYNERGDIRYKCSMNCANYTISDDNVSACVHNIMLYYSEYGPGIVSIVFNGSTAEEAVDKCKEARKASNKAWARSLIRFMLKDVEDVDPENEKRLVASLTKLFDEGEEECVPDNQIDETSTLETE